MLSPWLIGGMTSVSLRFFTVALSAVAKAQQVEAKGSPEGMVARLGIITTALGPVGTVQTESELRTATDDHGFLIEVREEVGGMEVDGLTLRVRQTEQRES